MRRLRGRGSVPGIALSGYGMDEDLRRSAEAASVTHLTKAIDFRELEEIIWRVASGSA